MAAKNNKKEQKQMHQNTITEIELLSVQQTRMEIAQKRKMLKELEANLEQQEESIIQRLQAGANVMGHMSAVLEKETGSCRPKWKEEYVSHMELEHGMTAKAVQLQMQEKYPAPERVILVIANKQ